ncbi:MAG: hypothetical protein JSV32_00680 [Dehalococcoidia bacterium]|nr:MAG: hypothetical protein JSV32_00680 [Dehalococcoidia bacterium]
MEPITTKQNWENQINQHPRLQTENKKETKHDEILEQIYQQIKTDPNTLGFLVIGSVATRTHTAKSDLDVITIKRNKKPSSGINQTIVDGIIVDSLYFTHEIMVESVNKAPYLLYPLVNSKTLFDRENNIEPLVEEVKDYFKKNPEIENEWKAQYNYSKQIKSQTGCRAQGNNGTIIDVWNLLEKRYSSGKIKRPFFNSFFLTNPYAFSLEKKLLGLLHKVKGGN